MEIKGHCFYNMENFEIADFAPKDVVEVVLQPCEIMTVDVETNDIIASTFIYVVIVTLTIGQWAGTKPLHEKRLAEEIAEELSKMCEDLYTSN